MIASEGHCKACGVYTPVLLGGFCGDCAPASAVDAYTAWWYEHYGADVLMPIDFFDDLLESGGELAGSDNDDDLMG